MRRREFVVAGGALATLPAWAHHGWSSFDQDRPLYLEGRAANVRWRNPHAELALELAPNLSLPADLAQRPVPAQQSAVNGPALLGKAVLPTRRDPRWEIELAPIPGRQDLRHALQPGLSAGQQKARPGPGFARGGAFQRDRASKARAVISSTLPVPLILRYRGALAASLAAHWP